MQDAEPVPVKALFQEAGRVVPVQVRRGAEWRRVRLVYGWTKREGLDLVRFFNVTDGANLYTLSFNDRRCAWLLHAICPM